MLTGVSADLGKGYYVALTAAALYQAIQLFFWKMDDPANCLRRFRANRDFGLIILAAIIMGKIYMNPNMTYTDVPMINMYAESDPVDFIRTQTHVNAPSILPELKLHLASEITPLWQLSEERLKAGDLPPPFWAFAWPGGQGVARYILDHPDVVQGKRVLDFAAGSGLTAIAAMQAGAAEAVAVDIDPLALHAIMLNAGLNGVAVEISDFIDMEKAPKHIDVITVGDVCYQQAMAAQVMRWLWLCVAAGIRVVMGDPGRAYVPESGLTELATYIVPTSLDIEDQESRTVKVWDVALPGENEL